MAGKKKAKSKPSGDDVDVENGAGDEDAVMFVDGGDEDGAEELRMDLSGKKKKKKKGKKKADVDDDGGGEKGERPVKNEEEDAEEEVSPPTSRFAGLDMDEAVQEEEEEDRAAPVSRFGGLMVDDVGDEEEGDDEEAEEPVATGVPRGAAALAQATAKKKKKEEDDELDKILAEMEDPELEATPVMSAAQKKKQKKKAKKEKAGEREEDLDTILAEMEGKGLSEKKGELMEHADKLEMPAEEDQSMTAAQKKKLKKKAKKGKKDAEADDIDAILLDIEGEKAVESLQVRDEVMRELASEGLEPVGPKEEGQVVAADDNEADGKDEESLSAAQKKKLKKKAKKERAKASTDDALDEKEDDVVPAPSKKKETAAVRKMREALERKKAEEERLQRLKEEEERKAAEEERRIEEEMKKKEEEKRRKKEAERLKKEQLRKEGKLLSKSEREKQRKAAAYLQQLQASGQAPVATGAEETRPKRPIYDSRKRKPRQPPSSADLKAVKPEKLEDSDAVESNLQEDRSKEEETTAVVEIEDAIRSDRRESGVADIVPTAGENESSALASISVAEAWDNEDWETKAEELKRQAFTSIEQEEDLALQEEARKREEEMRAMKEASVRADVHEKGRAVSVEDEEDEEDDAEVADMEDGDYEEDEDDEDEKENDDEDGGDEGDGEDEEDEEDESDEDEETDEEESSEYETSEYESESETEQDKKRRLIASRIASIRNTRERRLEEAMRKRDPNHLRSPIIAILGHVDTGKTKILDRIRRTNVQDGEAGGITQQIGATYFPIDAVKKEVQKLGDTDVVYKVPSLLIIDTPGHESFTNLRTRGSSLCDIAILVVDIMHGLEPQTLESIQLLRQKRNPFIVALNKIDRIYGWKPHPSTSSRESIKTQSRDVLAEFKQRVQDTKLAFAEQGFNSELYWDNPDPRSYVSLVPTSAITGEGIPDLLMLLVSLPQKLLVERMMFTNYLQCTVLEVKAIEGLGTTIDVVLTGGTLKEGDKIVVCGLDGPIVTKIRGLLTPHPMKEMRVKGQYLHHKKLDAAQGIKISAEGLDKALAGTQLLTIEDGTEDELLYLKEEVMKDLSSILQAVDRAGLGVYVQASTLGSLEALLEFLRTSKIPVSGVNIGPVHKRDITKCSTMLERKKEFAVILAFDVKVETEARELADYLGVRIFTADIIYHLFDQFTAYMEDETKRRREAASDDAVFPCILKILPQYVFNKKDPIIVGVQILEGIVKMGTPLVVHNESALRVPGEEDTGPWLNIGKVAGIEKEKKPVTVANRGDSVAIRIQSRHTEHIMYGRHFDHTNEIYSKISRRSIDLLKENFREDLTLDDWKTVKKLKTLFEIQ